MPDVRILLIERKTPGMSGAEVFVDVVAQIDSSRFAEERDPASMQKRDGSGCLHRDRYRPGILNFKLARVLAKVVNIQAPILQTARELTVTLRLIDDAAGCAAIFDLQFVNGVYIALPVTVAAGGNVCPWP